MTVILGISLTDRVYIAADTRISKRINGQIVPQHDDMMKIDNIEGTVIACAGDAGLAAHVLKGIRSQRLTDHGIDHFKQHISRWIAPMCEEYWSQISHTTHATFICAGRSTQRKRWVSRSLASSMLDAYINNPDTKGQPSQVKSYLFNLLTSERGDNIKTHFHDTVLFAISVSSNGIFLESASWGQHLIYGSPGLIKEDISPSQISRLEFDGGEEDGTHTMLLTACIYEIVKKRNLEGVGPTIVPVCISSDGLVSIRTGAVYTIDSLDNAEKPQIKAVSEIGVFNDQLSRVNGGRRFPLLSIEHYLQNRDRLVL